MKSGARRLTSAVCLFLLGVPASAAVDPALEQLTKLQGNAKAWDKAIEVGRQQAAFCFNCHGEEGVARQAEIPNLAAQPAIYLLEQIGKFARGERRDQFMEGLIKALSPDERLFIVAYFSSRPLPPASPSRAGNANAGKVFYQSLCHRCHGERGLGKDLLPTVAGQQEKYLVTSLKRYRDRTGERRNKEMSDATAKLSDQDIQNLAAYQHSLR
jgi:cytochrome c553